MFQNALKSAIDDAHPRQIDHLSRQLWAALAAGHYSMAHKGGFTLKTLTAAIHAAGFAKAAGKRCPKGLDLWVVTTKSDVGELQLRQLAEKLLPK